MRGATLNEQPTEQRGGREKKTPAAALALAQSNALKSLGGVLECARLLTLAKPVNVWSSSLSAAVTSEGLVWGHETGFRSGDFEVLVEPAQPLPVAEAKSAPTRPPLDMLLEMKPDDFTARYTRTIAALWAGVTERYSVTEADFGQRLRSVVTRATKHADDSAAASAQMADLLGSLRADELCLAVACEQGDERAWRKFESEYKHGMHIAARALTKDEAEAEDLVQFVFGELYGIRLDGERRLSKLAHYSGRGSLGGWLRAVVYQAFIDRKRQTARFEQVEEVSDFDRLANTHADLLNGQNGYHAPLHAPIIQPDDIEDVRLRRATEEAMTQAFAALEPKDRLMLNYYYFDDLTLREIGLLMNVHEATISRWLARAQKQIKKKTEEILQRNYGLRRAEIAECLAMAARSEVDVRKLLSEATAQVAKRAP
jgi:RNA polymerase sigma-70 factor (ECF subfamily)